MINVSAGIAIHVLSKTLTDRYLRAANLNLFQPRGLSARLCTTPAMLALLHSSESKTRSKMNKFGRGVGSVFLKLPIPIINPIASTIIHAIADKPPSISAGREGDPIKDPVLMRRLALTKDLALPLNLEGLPPPEKPQGVMDTVASWGVRFDTAREKSAEKNVEKRRRALERIKQAGLEAPYSSMRLLEGTSSSSHPRPTLRQIATSASSGSSSSPSNSSSFKGVASQAYNGFNDYRLQREIQQEQKQQQVRGFRRGPISSLIGEKKTRMERKVADADLLEHWSIDKFLWVVVMPLEKGKPLCRSIICLVADR